MHACSRHTHSTACPTLPRACVVCAPLSHCQRMHVHAHAILSRAHALLTPMHHMHQMGMLFFTELQVLTGAENALSPIGLLKQYTRAPNGQHTAAATAPTTKPSVGPKTLHLQQEGSKQKGGSDKGVPGQHAEQGSGNSLNISPVCNLVRVRAVRGVGKGLLHLRTPALLPWSCDSITEVLNERTCRGCCCLSRRTSS